MRIPLLRNIWMVWLLAIPGFLCGQSANTPELLGDAVNSDYNEIGPVISPDGKTLFFSRISHPQNANGENGSQDIWYSEFKNNRWMNAVRMPNVVNKDVYNSIYSITPDGNTILLKGSYNKGVYQTRGFSISKRVRRSWSPPETMLIPDYEKLSKGEFDCAFLANDGRTLIMSFSDKKKGRNDDLYVSFLDKDGKWSKPVSLGSDVNTPSHMETTPFLAADGLTLYFSSDRPGGKGGNDIYTSRRLDGSWKRWTKPVNLGSPVNTPGFEGYYTVAAAGDYAYWSSNQEGSTRKGDVFRLSLKTPEEKDTLKTTPIADVIAQRTRPVTAPDPVAMITGKVLDSKTGNPVEAKIVFSSFPDGRELGTASTNPETGEYKITLPFGTKYSLRPVAKDFVAENQLIDLTDAALGGGRSKDILLRSNRVGASDDSLTKGTGDAAVLLADKGNQKADEGKVDDGKGAKVAAAKRDGDSLSGVSKGDTTTQLADGSQGKGGDKGKSDTSVSDTAISGGEKDIELVTRTDTTTVTAARDSSHVRQYQEFDRTLTAVPIEIGGVVRLNNIFFETASSRLRAESRLELEQLVQMLKEHPTMKVELGGHTDSEGSEATNQRLSLARATAVRTYLTTKGIAVDRVTSVGYGESKPVGDNATPEGRQLNRRVELMILQK
jgi:OOP family OmpA-OmpF porin